MYINFDRMEADFAFWWGFQVSRQNDVSTRHNNKNNNKEGNYV